MIDEKVSRAESEQAQTRERVRDLLYKYTGGLHAADEGEVEQTLDAIEDVYTNLWNSLCGAAFKAGADWAAENPNATSLQNHTQ